MLDAKERKQTACWGTAGFKLILSIIDLQIVGYDVFLVRVISGKPHE